MDTVTRVHYEVVVDGKPVRLHREHNGRDRYACGEHTWVLVSHDDWRYRDAAPFSLPDEAAVRKFLRRGSTDWYNSAPDRPDWGRLDAGRFTFAKVTTTVVTEAFIPETADAVEFSDVVPDAYASGLSGPIRRRYGVAEDADATMFVVHARDDGTFKVGPDEARAALEGKTVTSGHRDLRLFSVERPDEHYYYVILTVVGETV